MVKGGVSSTTSRSRASEAEAVSLSSGMEKILEVTTPSREWCVEDEEGDWWNAEVEGGRRSLR